MAPDAKPNVKRSDEPVNDRLAMLKELAKLTKPTGKSAEGKSLDGGEE
ncbi:MAG: hypothetical protein AABX89_05395 [Candidatus Thermoplasmatota archaeon]